MKERKKSCLPNSILGGLVGAVAQEEVTRETTHLLSLSLSLPLSLSLWLGFREHSLGIFKGILHLFQTFFQGLGEPLLSRLEHVVNIYEQALNSAKVTTQIMDIFLQLGNLCHLFDYVCSHYELNSREKERIRDLNGWQNLNVREEGH